MKRTILILGSLAVGASALADAKADARAVEEAFAAAANIADPAESVKAVLVNFADDAQHIGIFGRVRGKKEFEQVLPKVFAAPNRKVVLLDHDAIGLDATHLVSISHYDNSFSTPDGKTVTLRLRCVRTMTRQKNGAWRISAEHTSVGAPPPPPPPAKP